MFSHIHWRIAASYTALITVVLVGLGVYLVGLLRAQQLSALEAQLQRQARLVADNAQYRLSTEGATGLDPLAKRLGREIGARITLIAADGTVLGDSEDDPATMDNHGARPEVLQALQTGSGQTQRHSATLEKDLLYVAVPVEQDGVVVGVARVALPVREVQEASNRVAAAVIGDLAVAAVLATALAVFLAGPVETLTHAVQRLARGDLHQEISVRGRDELSVLAGAFNELATRLRAHIRAVEDERDRLATVLGHMADGLVIIERHGRVRLINPTAARLLEVSPEQAEGRSMVLALRNHELVTVADEALVGGPSTGEPRLIELGSPGQRQVVQVRASRIPSEAGKGQQVVLLLQDVSELRRAEAVRREFVANVSHELRTPVACLKALVETLEDGALEASEAVREFLDRMQVEVDDLAQLVEELLELSRIESGRVSLHLQPVDLSPIVAAAAERLRPHAERQGLTFAVELPAGLAAARVDPTRIQQVVTNLVHNAVKFTPPGGHVTVTAEQRDGELAFHVVDDGVGIPPEALARLFERFYKVDKARGGGGTGLGLAIAKHLMQAHGGRIWAESEGEGQGSTFTFALPALPAKPHA
jgi:two-component system, OmpR family, phosphate regulon sensor histidine kinase PhoR